MALFQCKIFSKELFRSVNVNVTLPTPDSGDCFLIRQQNTRKREKNTRCSGYCMVSAQMSQTGSVFLPLSGMHRRKKLQL